MLKDRDVVGLHLGERRVARDAVAPVPLGNQPEVVAEWYWGDRVARNAALAEMNAYDIAILQHEYGIYGGEDGEDVVGFVRASPIPVIVVLHTVLSDPSPHQRLVLEELMEAADVLVTMTDAARAGSSPSTTSHPIGSTVIPHGAPPNIEGPRIIHRAERSSSPGD